MNKWTIVFWNVAGLYDKDKKFWEDLRKWDVLVLLETWVEKRGWNRIKEKLSRGFSWGKQWAAREEKKGRAKGRIIMGIRKERAEM